MEPSSEVPKAGRRPRTLINPQKDRRVVSYLETRGNWLEEYVPQVLRLRPGGWEDVDFQSAVRAARGQTPSAPNGNGGAH
mmetsp:Transcript_62850/g.101826  ORF Transcript_62850/g.101826 Transcript_62850/m.101826 type:complete len:80 (+) Transcript_62850:100-339(+)